MFIEKSKQALSAIDAHTGERDYLKVDKDATGFTIKVPAGKTKLKITKWYGVGQELAQEFNVVGSGSEKGVSGMTQITTGNAFAEYYCEAYSGYGANSLENNCTPKIVGAVDGVAVYRTPCQKEFFEFELSANKKIELCVEDVVLIEKTYSATLKQNLSVKETLGLKAFEDYFDTGVILNELHEADRIFFADGLPIMIDLDGMVSIWAGTTDETIKTTYGMTFIDCVYTKNEEGEYVATKRRMYFYFVDDENITANYEYAFNNFIPQKDIYFLFQFGKVPNKAIFGLERTEGGTETMWLWKENHEEDLTEFEEMSLSFLDVFKKYLADNELQFTPSKILNGSELLATSYGGGFSHTADFYPIFYSSDTYVLGIMNPTSNKCLKTQFKFLEHIRDLGLYPSIGIPYSSSYSGAVGSAINERNVAGWNNKSVINFLAGNVSLGLATSSLALKTNDSVYDKILAIESGETVSYCLTTLDKNYIPNSSIFKPVQLFYYGGKKVIFDVSKKSFYIDSYTKAEETEIKKVENLVLANISKISVIYLMTAITLSKNTLEVSKSSLSDSSYFDAVEYFLNIFADDFMPISDENIFTLADTYETRINENILSDGRWLVESNLGIDVLKYFLSFMGRKGVVLKAINDTVSCFKKEGEVNISPNNLSCLYAILESEGFILKSLLIGNIEFYSDSTGYTYNFDFSRVWLKYSNGAFDIREYIGLSATTYGAVLDDSFYSVQMPLALKNFLKDVVLPKLGKAYETLSNMKITITNTSEIVDVGLSQGQIEGILRDLFNQYIYKKSMLVLLSFDFLFSIYNQSNGQTTTAGNYFNSGVVDVSSPINISFDSGYSNTVASSLQATYTSSAVTVNEQEQAPKEVTITVADANKTRTIVYISPVEIASISINGERIDVGNRMIDADIPRKFSIGNSTVTWKNSTITVYNFGAVMSLRIGDASFII